jgi:hypothetical protein
MVVVLVRVLVTVLEPPARVLVLMSWWWWWWWEEVLEVRLLALALGVVKVWLGLVQGLALVFQTYTCVGTVQTQLHPKLGSYRTSRKMDTCYRTLHHLALVLALGWAMVLELV